MKGFYTILLLVLSNTLMTIAWYGHLRFKDMSFVKNNNLIKNTYTCIEK